MIFRASALLPLIVVFATTARSAPIPLGAGVTVECFMTDASACNLTDQNPLTWSIAEAVNDTTTQLGVTVIWAAGATAIPSRLGSFQSLVRRFYLEAHSSAS
jgi:hypothetical protein